MYESSFNLESRPFLAIPSADRYFPSESIENARISLERMIRRDEGPGLVVGPVGMGKSLLAQLIAENLRSDFRVSLIPGARICTRRSLIQMILHQFGLPFKNMEEGELRLSLIDHVTSTDFCPNGTVIIVDEADALPMSLLDELRTMTNTVAANQHCIRLVLFGALSLEEKIGHPRMESLNQRLAGRFYLEPFNRDETFEYIAFQIEHCGGDPAALFTVDAMETAYQATNGVPRLINQLCDHALIVASQESAAKIDVDLMNAAWSNLQQLPIPSMDRMQMGSSEVEFGELDDTPDIRDKVESQLDQVDGAIEQYEVSEFEAESDLETPATIKIHKDIEAALSESTDDEFEVSSSNEEARQDLEVTPPKLAESLENPFDEEFESEELVVDQFVSAKIIARRESRTVCCERSESLSISVRQYFAQNAQVADLTSTQDDDAIQMVQDHETPVGTDSSDGLTLEPTTIDEAFPTLDADHKERSSLSAKFEDFSDDPVYPEDEDRSQVDPLSLELAEDEGPVAYDGELDEPKDDIGSQFEANGDGLDAKSIESESSEDESSEDESSEDQTAQNESLRIDEPNQQIVPFLPTFERKEDLVNALKKGQLLQSQEDQESLIAQIESEDQQPEPVSQTVMEPASDTEPGPVAEPELDLAGPESDEEVLDVSEQPEPQTEEIQLDPIELEITSHQTHVIHPSENDICYEPIVVETDLMSLQQSVETEPEARIEDAELDEANAEPSEVDCQVEGDSEATEPAHEVNQKRHIVPIVRIDPGTSNDPNQKAKSLAKGGRSYKRLFLRLRKAN